MMQNEAEYKQLNQRGAAQIEFVAQYAVEEFLFLLSFSITGQPLQGHYTIMLWSILLQQIASFVGWDIPVKSLYDVDDAGWAGENDN